MQRLDPRDIFGTDRPLIGMVHLRPLPGAPGHRSMTDVIDAACRDAAALADGGFGALMVENFGDAPFYPDRVPAETIAALTAAVVEVRRLTSLSIGVNVLRNDALAALAIAHATGARFIRINVHTGAMLTDQGWISGRAHETLRARAALGARVAILADVLVKHATPPAGLTAADAARDTWERGGADALIVSGAATGAATPLERVREVKAAVPDAPVLIGSGLSPANAKDLLAVADGAIVGSAVQQDGRAGGAVDAARVRALLDAVR
jgi:membrane complex biogenesis BtpA family protein